MLKMSKIPKPVLVLPGFGISGVDTLETITNLNELVSEKTLRRVMSAKMSMSPKMLLYLAGMLSHFPQSRHPRKRIVWFVLRRVLHTLKNPLEFQTSPQDAQQPEEDFSICWIDCPLTHPGLDHFTYAIKSNFVPFLRGDRSLSLTKILEILCILRHHLILAYEQMRNIQGDIDSGGQGSDALCSDVRYSTCGQERPFEEQQNYHAAKESIYVISDLLQRIEQVLPTFLEIFNLYVQMCSK